MSFRPWSLCKGLSGEAAHDCTGNPWVDKVGAALTVPGTPAACLRWGTGVGIVSHTLRALEHSLPELQPECHENMLEFCKLQ